MRLMPNYLVQYAMQGRMEEAEAFGVMSCVGCGTCSYNCPGHMPIVQYIRVAKGAINARQAETRVRAEVQNETEEKEDA
jgi:electron transport complex protein RnfC